MSDQNQSGQVVFNQRLNRGSRVDLPITADGRGSGSVAWRVVTTSTPPQAACGSASGLGRLGGHRDQLGTERFALLRPVPGSASSGYRLKSGIYDKKLKNCVGRGIDAAGFGRIAAGVDRHCPGNLPLVHNLVHSA
jgi:hypothetical protein